MYIDFHTHIFPDQIAENAIQSLQSESHIKALGTGMLTDLTNQMKQSSVKYSVVLPVITKPSQFESVNAFAQSINGKEGIISFGGIHPDNENIAEKISLLKEMGLKGIKLHPDYQGPTYIDDKKYITVIQECIKQDMCVLIHAGYDVGRPIPIHCPPDRTYLMLKEVLKDCNKDPKIILAHMGGMLQWELVEKILVGENIYMDLAYCNVLGNKDQITRIIKKHGANRILYATDYPWTSQIDMINFVNEFSLSAEEKECIFYKNAARLLDLID